MQHDDYNIQNVQPEKKNAKEYLAAPVLKD